MLHLFIFPIRYGIFVLRFYYSNFFVSFQAIFVKSLKARKKFPNKICYISTSIDIFGIIKQKYNPKKQNAAVNKLIHSGIFPVF